MGRWGYLVSILALLLCLATGGWGAATSYTYTGATGGDWGLAANWRPTGIPVSGDSVTFTSAVTVNLTAPRAVSKVIFDTATAVVVLQSGPGPGDNALAIDANGSITSNANVTGTNSIACTVTLNGATTFTNNSATGTLIFGGLIGGANGSLTTVGNITLSGLCTYGGATAVNPGILQLQNSTGSQGVFTNVPEAANYKLVYALSIGTNANLSGGVPYSVDNSAAIADGSFSRVGYYLELQKSGSPLQWVYVSFDAANLSTKANKLGVPILSTGEFYHYRNGSAGSVTITNMNVVSNVAGIVTGTGISTGVIQFWPSNYGNANGYGVPNNPGGWGVGDDAASGTTQGYGSMKMGNCGVGAQQMLFAFNNWNGGTYDLGIGNGVANGAANNDYTFAANAGAFTVKNLYVVVGPGSGSVGNNGNNVLPTTTMLSVVSGGTLDLGGCSQTLAALSGGGNIINNGMAAVITLTSTGSNVYSGVIANGTGVISLVLNNGTETFTNANTYTGTTTINNAAMLQLGDGNNDGSLAGPIVNNNTATGLAAGLVFNVTVSQTYGNVISGPGSLLKTGPGILNLNGNSTYLGTTVINQGMVKLKGAIPGLYEGMVNQGNGTLDTADPIPQTSIQLSDRWGEPPITASTGTASAFPSWGIYTTWGYKGFFLNPSATGVPYIFSKNFDDQARLVLDAGLPTSVTYYDNGWQNHTKWPAVTLSPGWHSIDLRFYQGNGGVGPNGADSVAFNGGHGMAFSTDGGATWSSFTDPGDASLLAVTIGANNILPPGTALSIAAGATLDLNGSKQQLGSLVGPGSTVTNGSSAPAVLTLAPAVTDTFDGVIVDGFGSLALTKSGAGTLVLTGVNTYSGATTISSGTLQVGTGGSASIATSASISFGANSALVYNISSNETFNGAISGAGTLTMGGTGVLTLGGACTYTGATSVTGGTLLVTGTTAAASAVGVANGATLGGTGTVAGTVTLAAGATLSPGTGGTPIGTLATGALTCPAGSTFQVDLNGAGPAADVLNAPGQTVALGGTLNINNSVNQIFGTVFTIINAGSITGTFAGLADGAYVDQPTGQRFIINYVPASAPTSVTLTYGSIPAAPLDLVATTVSTTEIDLNWEAISAYATSYKVYRRTATGGYAEPPLAILGPAATTYQDTGLLKGKTFYYIVVCTNAFGQTPSNEATATTNSNTAPVITQGVTVYMADEAMNAPEPMGPVGSTITDILTGTNGVSAVVDIDPGAFSGVALYSANKSNGKWFFSLDNGSHWQLLPALGITSALLLPADGQARLYFWPRAGWSGYSYLQFRAWDQTTDLPNPSIQPYSYPVNPTPGGGVSAYSAATGLIQVAVGDHIEGIAIDAAPSGGGGHCGLGSGLALATLFLAGLFLQCLSRCQRTRFRHLLVLASTMFLDHGMCAEGLGEARGDAPAPKPAPAKQDPSLTPRAPTPEEQRLDEFLNTPQTPVYRTMMWMGLGIMPDAKYVNGFSSGQGVRDDWGTPWRVRLGFERLWSIRYPDSFYYGVEIGYMAVKGHEAFPDPNIAATTRALDVGETIVPVVLHGGWRWEVVKNLHAQLGVFAGLGPDIGSVDYAVLSQGKIYDEQSRGLGYYAEGGLRGACLWTQGRWSVGLDLRWQAYARSRVRYDISQNYNVGSFSDTVTSQVGYEGLAWTVMGGCRF